MNSDWFNGLTVGLSAVQVLNDNTFLAAPAEWRPLFNQVPVDVRLCRHSSSWVGMDDLIVVSW